MHKITGKSVVSNVQMLDTRRTGGLRHVVEAL